jgi:hypothetical protein
MHRPFARAGALLLFLASGACGGSSATDLTWTSEGQLCLASIDPGQTDIVADDPLQISVTFGGCDCGEDVTTKLCAIERSGDSFTVTSEASSIEDGCDPCVPIVAVCELGPLGDGTYSVQHGGDLLIIEVPSIDDACIGETSPGEVL